METEIAELKAMAQIAEVFATLEEDEVQRVLKWALEKYRVKGGTPLATPSVSSGDITSGRVEPHTFADLPQLMDAAKPTNGLERILAVAFFYQNVKGEADFDSQTLNTQLKHLGYPSANITRDLDRLVNRSPKLVIQIRKEGSSQQARKKFRLTTEGVRAVETMLKKSSVTSEE